MAATPETITADATALPDRPKRADARRNYDKLVAAAREVFAEQETGATLEEISKRAGVGIGTLYRHFPRREDLLEATYLGGVEEICAAVPIPVVAIGGMTAARARAVADTGAAGLAGIGLFAAGTERALTDAVGSIRDAFGGRY